MDLVDKIRSRGYWEVTIRPSTFDKNRIPDIDHLYSILQKSYVSLKGFDFPLLDQSESPRYDLDFISQEFEFSHVLSSWRFYQSGLFLLLLGIPDDWRDQSSWWPQYEGWAPLKDLGVGEAMLIFVESLEFAARIAESDAGDESMHIEIKIVKARGRQLYMDIRRKWGFFRNPVADLDEFPYSTTVTRTELLASPRKLAIAGAVELFKRFGWSKSVDELGFLFGDYLRR